MSLDGMDYTRISKENLMIGTRNRILYGLIYAEKMPLNLLAQRLDVSVHELHKWCFKGQMPDPEVREKLSEYFDLPEQILFWEAEH